MSQKKKTKVQDFNIWTASAQELHKGLKALAVPKRASTTTVKAKTKTVSYDGNRQEFAIKFGSTSSSPLFGRLKKA